MNIEIRRCAEKDLEILRKTIARPEFHLSRFKSQQKSDSIYLIAWMGDVPVGHLNLKLRGSDEAYVKHKLGFIPELNAIGVEPPEMRSKGIGRRLINEAERICKDRDSGQVGLAVDTHNSKAIKLYKSLGYKDSGIGEFDSVWHEIQDDGTEKEVVDHCVYLVKQL